MATTEFLTKVDRRAGGSEQSISGEAHVIGEDTANLVWLVEAPLEESPTSVSISGTPAGGGSFSEVSAAPSAGEYWIHYTGRGGGSIEFNAADDGIAITVDYEGRGSVLTARDFNRVQAHLDSMELNVLAYGAVEGGTVDNQAAFQAAIDAGEAAEVGIFIPAGSWRVNGELEYGDNLVIRGAGTELTVLNFYGAVDGFVNSDVTERRLNVRIADMNIRSADQNGLVAVDLDNVSTGVFENLLMNRWGTGVDVHNSDENDSATYNRFYNVRASSCDYGWRIRRKSANSATLWGCRAVACTQGIEVFESNNALFFGCQIESNTDGILIWTDSVANSADGCVVIGCRFENNSGTDLEIADSGVRIAQVIGNLFISGTFTDNGTDTTVIDGRQGLHFGQTSPAVDYTITNPSTSRTLNVSTATVGQVAAVVGTIMQDLIDLGLAE